MKNATIPFDARKLTSLQNGMLGGRPKIDIMEIVESFSLEYIRDGKIFLRSIAEKWYVYESGIYKRVTKQDLLQEIITHIQNNFSQYKPSRSLAKDVLHNLESFNYCGLKSSFRPPCWTDGSDASGLIVMKNVIVDLEALVKEEAVRGECRSVLPLTPDLFTTLGLPYEYDPEAVCLKFMQYLERVQPNPENRYILQLLAGLSLIPENKYEVAFMLFGEGGTGKSVFLHVLAHLVGQNNVCNIPIGRFGGRFGLEGLTTCLLNIVGDMPTAGDFSSMGTVEGVFKDVVSGGEIPVERKFENMYRAKAIARNIFATNSLPLFSDTSNAIWSRLRIIPFNQIIRGTGEDNKNLKNELIAELPGIFNWAIQGLRELNKLTQFPDCPEGEAIKHQHREACDREGTFLREFYSYDTACFCSTMDAYHHYRDWMKYNGYRPAGMAKFSQSVSRVFPETYKDKVNHGGQRIHVWSGLKYTG